MWTVVIIICALLSLARAAFFNSFSGPFDIVFHKMERCPGPIGEQRIVDLDPAHPTRDRHNKYGWWYNGVVSSFMDFSDDVYGEMNVASWSSRGGWTPNAYRFSADRLCSLIKYVIPYVPEEMVRNATNALGMASVDDFVCPFPQGNYTVKDLYINLDISHLVPPIVPYGKWRSTVTAAKNKTTPMVFCARVYADIIPKPGGKSGKFPTRFNMSMLSSIHHGGHSMFS